MIGIDIYNLCGNLDNSDEFYIKSKHISSLLEYELSQYLYTWVEQMKNFIENVRKYAYDVDDDWFVPKPCEGALELMLMWNTWIWYQRNIKGNDSGILSGNMTYDSLMQMMEYAKKSNEFKEEMIRWRAWMSYFVSLSGAQWQELWSDIDKVQEWMVSKCSEAFDRYIAGVDASIQKWSQAQKQYKDYALITRPKTFYYINILGAQILNRMYREEFLAAQRKYIFLPGCMSYRMQFDSCAATSQKDGYACQGCSNKCNICKVNKYTDKMNAIVRIVYHESEMNNKKVDAQQKIGVIGVACLLNLVSGGFKARRLGYIPQCVILDYPGCVHWIKEDTNNRVTGKPTQINKNELQKVIGGRI